MCQKVDGSTYHELKCLMGECSSCGPNKKFKACPMEECSGCMVKVKVFEDVEVGYTDAGKKKKRKILSFKQIQCKELLILFKDHLKKFVWHNFIYRWQAEKMKECILRFPEDVVVSVVDFVKNYTFKKQNKVQTMHWYLDQVTIFVHITYVRVALVVNKFYHFYISDNKNHDTLFVQHCFMLHYQWLEEIGVSPKEHWVWLDGAAS